METSEVYNLETLRQQQHRLGISLREIEANCNVVTPVVKNGHTYLLAKHDSSLPGLAGYFFERIAIQSQATQKHIYTFLKEERDFLFGYSLAEEKEFNDETISSLTENIWLINRITDLYLAKCPTISNYPVYHLTREIIDSHIEGEMYRIRLTMKPEPIKLLKQQRISNDAAFQQQIEQLLQLMGKMDQHRCDLASKRLGKLYRIIGRVQALRKMGSIIDPEAKTDAPKIFTFLKQLYFEQRLLPKGRQLQTIPHLNHLYPRVHRLLKKCMERLEAYESTFPIWNLPPDVQGIIMGELFVPIAWPSTNWMIRGFKKWAEILKDNQSEIIHSNFVDYFCNYTLLLSRYERQSLWFYEIDTNIRCSSSHDCFYGCTSARIATYVRQLVSLHAQEVIFYQPIPKVTLFTQAG